MSNSFEHLLPPSWKSQVAVWFAEDTPSFDYGGYVVGEAHREAFLFGKGNDAAVLAGSPFFTEVFAQIGCEWVLPVLRIVRLDQLRSGWNGMSKKEIPLTPLNTSPRSVARRAICYWESGLH